MIGMSIEGEARVNAAAQRFVDDAGPEAHEWLMSMGYAISGNTQWLNRHATGGRLNIYPSVRKQPGGVRLNITWRKANRGTRRIVAKSFTVAQRHIWTRWTAKL